MISCNWPFWGLHEVCFIYRAIVHGRLLNWVLAGVFLAGAFWSKYAAVVLAAPLGCFLIFDPVARRNLAHTRAYVMALFFLVVIAPNVWWLVTNDFLPFRYADERAKVVGHWYDYFVFLVEWAAARTLTLLPVSGVIGCDLLARHNSQPPGNDGLRAFNRRYVRCSPWARFLLTTNHQRGGGSTGDYHVGATRSGPLRTCCRTLVRTNYSWR